jgi:hypothetical protein
MRDSGKPETDAMSAQKLPHRWLWILVAFAAAVLIAWGMAQISA